MSAAPPPGGVSALAAARKARLAGARSALRKAEATFVRAGRVLESLEREQRAAAEASESARKAHLGARASLREGAGARDAAWAELALAREDLASAERAAGVARAESAGAEAGAAKPEAAAESAAAESAAAPER